MLFYTNVCGNVEDEYRRDQIDSQLKSELMTALQPAFAKISEMGIRYSALPGHTEEIAAALNDVLSEKWGGLRGIKISSFGVSSVKASDEDEKMIKELQRNAAFRNPNMAAALLSASAVRIINCIAAAAEMHTNARTPSSSATLRQSQRKKAAFAGVRVQGRKRLIPLCIPARNAEVR